MMKKVYHPALDILRTISILAVILIHTTTRTLELSHYNLKDLQTTLFLNQASRFAVPLFFIVSGFALTISNHSNLNYWQFLKKRFSKVLIPYLFWTLIYYFFIYKDQDNLLKAIFTGSASYQLYFIPSILIFYLIYPFLTKLYKFWSKKLIIIILFLIQISILYSDYKFHTSIFPYPISVALFNFFPFLLGIYLAKNQKSLLRFTKKFWPFFATVAILLSFFIFKEGFTNYYKTYNYIYFYSQWRPSVLIYTISIFLGLYYLGNQVKEKYFNITKTLSSISFTVFFIHIIILEIVYKLVYEYSHKLVYKYDFLFILTVSVFSILTGLLCHKVKFLSRFTG